MQPATSSGPFHRDRLRKEAPGESYGALVLRLSEMSVRKAHDPYLDIPWDEPAFQIDLADPRLELQPYHPLARTSWYANLDSATRGRFGIESLAQALRYAIDFEAVLSRGLLAMAQQTANGVPEYRYMLHEVIEEARHSLMFQELITRLGADPQPVGGVERWLDDRIAMSGRRFPELFFFAVLGGEIFVDEYNRELLRRPAGEVHPLVRRVMQIHVTEEARHVCFAERYLQRRLPRLGTPKRLALRAVVPVLLSEPVRMLLAPPRTLTARYGIPKATLREAFGPGSEHRRLVARTVEPVRALCETHGLWWPAAWRALGLSA